MNKYETKLANPDEFQQEIDKMGRIKFYGDTVINTLGDLIYYLFVERLETRYERYNRTQCRPRAARSIDDCYKAARYYNLNCNLKQIKEAVELLYKSRRSLGIDRDGVYNILLQSYCSVVKKRVHNPRGSISKSEINIILSNNNMNYEKVSRL